MLLGEGSFYTQQAIKAYGQTKALKNFPQEVLDIVDIAVLENKIKADISKSSKKPKIWHNNGPDAIGELVANLNDPKFQKDFKSYSRMRRFRKVFQSAVDSKAWKLFKGLSDWKKSFKQGTLKLLRKSLGKKIWRQKLGKAWKSS